MSINDQHCFTVPELAKRWRVKADQVRAWIRSGELDAMDMSSRPGVGRPRFKISIAAVVEFELRRQYRKPLVAPMRQKAAQRLPSDFIEYF